jgi:hypothetical protein
MSTSTDLADQIRDRILTAPAVGEIATLVNLLQTPVIVVKQKSIEDEVKAAVSKISGCAILIEWTGFRTRDKNASRPFLDQIYTISVWSKPIIDDGNRPAELVIKSVIQRLWHWVPDGGHSHGEAVPGSGSLTPNKSYLIYDAEFVIPETL